MYTGDSLLSVTLPVDRCAKAASPNVLPPVDNDAPLPLERDDAAIPVPPKMLPVGPTPPNRDSPPNAASAPNRPPHRPFVDALSSRDAVGGRDAVGAFAGANRLPLWVWMLPPKRSTGAVVVVVVVRLALEAGAGAVLTGLFQMRCGGRD